jgi:hypothetical protein
LLVVLAILAVSLAGGRERVEYPAEDPVGVVQRYLLAVEEGRFEAAREYLSPELENEKGRLPAPPFRAVPDRVRRIVLISETIEAVTAVVIVEISTSYGRLESNPSRNRITFELLLTDGAWKIRSPTLFPY